MPKPDVKKFLRTRRHFKLMALGLAVVLFPIVTLGKSLSHAHQTVTKATKEVHEFVPKFELLGFSSVEITVFFVVVCVCWVLGILMVTTAIGRRIMNWEASRFLPENPLWKAAPSSDSGDEPAVTPATPALVKLGDAWQPCVIVEGPAAGWTSVYVPEIPDTTKGRLALVAENQVRPLDVPLEAFRDQLGKGGRGSEGWLRALAEGPLPNVDAAPPNAPS